jgi:hypothetical protein
MKALTLLSGVILLALTISAAIIVYMSLVPVIKKMQTAAVIQKMTDTFSELDTVIKEVASQGKGSKRVVSLGINLGKVVVNGSDDVIYWEYETDAPVISPRTRQRFGDLVIGADLKTKAYEANYTFTSPDIPSYVMENEHLKVYVRKIGSPSNQESYTTNQLVVGIYQKDLGKWLNNTGFLDIYVDNNVNSKSGTGYTVLEESGSYLPYATVTAFMNSSYAEYYINFTLESGTDFVQIKGWT